MAKRKKPNISLDREVNRYVQSVMKYERLERQFARLNARLSKVTEGMVKQGMLTQSYLNRLTLAQRTMAWTILHKAVPYGG